MITTALKTGHTPYQLWFGKKSNLKHIQLLGVCPYPRQKQDIKSSFIIETTMPRIMCAIFCVGVAFSEEVVLFGEWAGFAPPTRRMVTLLDNQCDGAAFICPWK